MFSSLVTATKTRYATLRGGDEADGDTEDDSHLSRVLRNYYTEKGQPFPPWLGGGPQQLQSGRVGTPAQQGGVNLRRGNNSSGSNGPQPGVKATLSDIWDKPQATQQQQPVNPGIQGQAAGQNAQGMNKMRFFRRPQDQPSQQEPEPQNTAAQSSIRDRLWSNRTPAQGRTPPPQQQQAPQSNQYGGGYDNAPISRERSPARQQYQAPASSSSGKPYVGSSSPWQNDEPSYAGGGGYSAYNGGSSGSGNAPAPSGGSGFRRGAPAPGGRIGLPTGPKMMRP
ncbi:Sec1-binding region of Mso1-domain-containing protein [Peziza echinospora]|nr:Sec1-binding region of Mso1-domain-containing protein [Peziza echinospora]